MFVRAYPAGLAFDGVPGSANLTLIDLQVSRAIDGFGGGVYAPAVPIEIGGAGLLIPSGGTLTVVAGGTLDVAGDLDVTGPAVFDGSVEINGALQVDGAATFNSTTVLNGTTTVASSLNRTTTQTYTRGPMGLWSKDTAGDPWGPSGTAAGIGLQQLVLNAVGPQAIYRMQAPPPCTITEAALRINPAAHASLPNAAQRFKFDILVFDPADPVGTMSTTTVLDASGSTAVYDAEHDVENTGLSIAVAAGYMVLVKVYGESSADPNTVLFGVAYLPRLTFTRTRIGEE
jgi:hypothetical protein